MRKYPVFIKSSNKDRTHFWFDAHTWANFTGFGGLICDDKYIFIEAPSLKYISMHKIEPDKIETETGINPHVHGNKIVLFSTSAFPKTLVLSLVRLLCHTGIEGKILYQTLSGFGLDFETSEDVLPELTPEVFALPECPKWAKYAAVDECGGAYWYSDKPVLISSMWMAPGCTSARVISGKFHALGWKSSLIQKPEPVKEFTIEELEKHFGCKVKIKRSDSCDPG